MELADFEILDYLTKYPSTSFKTKLSLLRDISKAIEFLSNHKIVHRDIKAPNCFVFLDKKNNSPVAKLGDVGCVEICTGAEVDSAGTHAYTAPEIRPEVTEYGTYGICKPTTASDNILVFFLFNMDKQATKPATEKPTITKENKTSLGKRKKSKSLEDNHDDLDSVELSKKTQKVTHSNMIERESVEKMNSELMREPSFVQNKMACVCGYQHTITLSDDGTAYSFGRNYEGQLGLRHNNNV